MKIFLSGLLFLGVLWLPLQYLQEAFRSRVPDRYLDFPRGRVYLTRESFSTVEAIKKGTHFILENTKPGQEILALPREPLYCFLSDRRQALPQINFERHGKTEEWREDEYVRQLQTKSVPLVLLANRDGSNPLAAQGAGGIGYFGKTHYKKLGDYIFEHYREVQTFGTWETDRPRIFHAIKIFQRES